MAPADVPAERKADAPSRLRRGRASRGGRGQPGPGELRGESPPGHGRQLGGPVRRRRPHQGPARRPGGGDAETAAWRPGSRRSAGIAASSWSRTAPASGSPSAAPQVALTLLDADPAPAGAMPVVVGGGFGGVLFHEMTGHGLEADHIQKGASVYAGKLGERVAEPTLEAFDDGRLPGEWGTDAIDDEGTPCPADAGDPRGPHHRLSI